MPTGAPDWQTVVSIVPSVTAGAPDWEKVVVGPGGVPISGGGAEPGISAADFGYAGWTFPPTLLQGDNEQTAGAIVGNLVKWQKSMTINYVGLGCTQAAVGLLADENYVGIYSVDVAGGSFPTITLLASSASGAIDALFGAAAIVACPLSAGLAVTAGDYAFIATLFNPGAVAGDHVPGLWANLRTFDLSGSFLNGWPINGTGFVTTSTAYSTLPTTLAGTDLVAASPINLAWCY